MVLVINFGLVEREFVAIHDINDLFAQRIWIISLTSFQSKPSLCGLFFNGSVCRVLKRRAERYRKRLAGPRAKPRT